VERAAAADDADVSLLVDAARHDADFTFAGEMMPGQFGPMSRVFLKSRRSRHAPVSRAGMPSVMHTVSGSSASGASRIASAAYAEARK